MKAVWIKLRRNRPVLIGLGIMLLYLMAAALAPWIAPFDPYTMHTDSLLSAPNKEHWLGTDPFGRDILSRLMHGARISLFVGATASGLALLAGTVIGVLAGFLGRWIDGVLSRLMEVVFAFPDILLALVVMAILGPSTINVALALAIVYTPIYARVARASTLRVKQEPYVEAARIVGGSNTRIMLRHILPNITAPLIIQTSLSMAFAILAEAALSFLGLGGEPDAPSWGMMLNQGKDWMEQGWWVAVFPGLAITLAVLSFNVVGDGLRDAWDPKAQ